MTYYLRIVQSIDVRGRFSVSPDQRSYQTDRLSGRRLLGTFGLGRQPTSPALQSVRPDHLLDHADGETLLKPAELTPISTPLVHRAVLVCQANVLCILLDCSLEETFAAFAGDDPVVKAGGLVLADVADQRLLVLRGRDQQRGRSVLKKKSF